MTKGKAFLLVVAGVSAGVALCAGLLAARGFRANATPSRFETVAARTVRNFAIPRGERKLANPVVATADNLQAGQEVFKTDCAICHGVDAQGRTQIGLNSYPRVPDLHSDATQKLTDGELHYIIENGVQLTGMPAWRSNPHRTSNDDSWKLVLFIRGLKPLTLQETAEQAEVAGSAQYVGSEKCASCHQKAYDGWKQTRMANVVLDPKVRPEAVLGDFTHADAARTFKLDQVAFTYGSRWKQRYFTKVGDDYFVLPAQWDVKKAKWLPYHTEKGTDWWVPFYGESNMERPTGPLCDGCHSVNYNIETKQVSEWNVGCEKCHGPGSVHVAHPTRGNIVNPDRLDTVAGNDTCIQCHSQGQPLSNPIKGKYYDWPVGYAPGKRLANFWKLEELKPGVTNFYQYADMTAHKNRMQGNDFVQSNMYHREVRCSSCHDVHSNQNTASLIAKGNAVCLGCHTKDNAAGLSVPVPEHTHHATNSAGSECTACHMPKIEQTIKDNFVSAHTFRFITPAETERSGVPNPCTSCHADKTTQWATNELKGWSSVSPWRMTQ